jgi:hypothetical protein
MSAYPASSVMINTTLGVAARGVWTLAALDPTRRRSADARTVRNFNLL